MFQKLLSLVRKPKAETWIELPYRHKVYEYRDRVLLPGRVWIKYEPGKRDRFVRL